MENKESPGSPFRFRVLSTGISSLTMPVAVSIIGGWIASRRREYVNVCNADVILQSYDDPRLAEIINNSGPV